MCQRLQISVLPRAVKIQNVMTATSVQQIHARRAPATFTQSLSAVVMVSAPQPRPLMVLALETAVVMVYALLLRLPVVTTPAPKTAATVLATVLLALTPASLPLAQLGYVVLTSFSTAVEMVYVNLGKLRVNHFASQIVQSASW